MPNSSIQWFTYSMKMIVGDDSMAVMVIVLMVLLPVMVVILVVMLVVVLLAMLLSQLVGVFGL